MDLNSRILQPIRIGNLTLKNRMEIAPHGSALHDRDGGIGEKMMAYLRNQARGGAGLAVIGSGSIDREPSPFPVAHPANPFLIGNYINAVEMMHQYDCKLCMQLFPGKEMMMPSDVVANSYTKEQIKDLVDRYADAAFNCMQAGFDMIMIHGAHGNGPAMFFSPLYNHRTDEYGGSLENRARVAVEVLDAIRGRCGDRIAIEYRLSAEEITEGGASLEDNIAFARLIQDRIDLLHISRGMLEDNSQLSEIFTPTYYEHGINLKYAREFKKELHIPVTVIGGFTPELAAEAVERGDVDMVSMCRTFLADPQCVTKTLRGKEDEIRPCVRCNTCINQTHARLWDIRCAVNPLLGRETQIRNGYPAVPEKCKKVVLVGGGPANLEAARTAASRGHRVILMEKESELGGNLRYAAAPYFKNDMRRYLDWSVHMLEKQKNVEVRLNCEVTREMIVTENPDALIIAVGATPVIPPFSAAGTDKVVWAGDILKGNKTAGNRVVIAGSGFTGLETALFLSGEGKKVAVVDMIPADRIGADAPLMSMVGLKKMLARNHVTFINEVKVQDVTEEGVKLVSLKDGSESMLSCDTVVLSLGMRRNTKVVEELSGIVPETYVIGDCSNVGGVLWKAVRSGFDMGMEL